MSNDLISGAHCADAFPDRERAEEIADRVGVFCQLSKTIYVLTSWTGPSWTGSPQD